MLPSIYLLTMKEDKYYVHLLISIHYCLRCFVSHCNKLKIFFHISHFTTILLMTRVGLGCDNNGTKGTLASSMGQLLQ